MPPKPPEWILTDHVCRQCFGRVLQRKDPETGNTIVRCADCTLTGVAPVQSICACGVDARKKGQVKLACMRQEQPTAEFPSEIIVAEVKRVHRPG